MKIKLTKDSWNNVRIGDKVFMHCCINCDATEPTMVRVPKESIVTKKDRNGIYLNGCYHTINGIDESDYYIPAHPLISLETLNIGDEVVDRLGSEFRILMAQGEGEYRCYILGAEKGALIAPSTAYELKRNGFTIKQPSDQEQPRELTIDEIAEKFGMKAEDVRIKKEAE